LYIDVFFFCMTVGCSEQYVVFTSELK